MINETKHYLFITKMPNRKKYGMYIVMKNDYVKEYVHLASFKNEDCMLKFTKIISTIDKIHFEEPIIKT